MRLMHDKIKMWFGRYVISCQHAFAKMPQVVGFRDFHQCLVTCFQYHGLDRYLALRAAPRCFAKNTKPASTIVKVHHANERPLRHPESATRAC